MSERSDREMTEAQKRVLAAAEEVFAERGYSGAATSEIAKRAGVAEGTIFKHYKTKKDLLFGVIAPLFVRFIAPFMLREVEDILNAPYEHFGDFLRAMFKNRLKFVEDHRASVRIAIQEIPFHPELRALAKEAIVDRILPRIFRIIEHFQREGEVADLPVRSVARLVSSAFAGYILARYFLAPELPWDDEAEIEITLQVLLRGLAPDPKP